MMRQCDINEDLVYSQAVAIKDLGLLVSRLSKRGSLDT